MSQNKFMHPRNIYKQPPNFKEMAIKYPEFRKYAKPDISGKITIDFKNPDALKALTCTLLQKDFDLNIDIPVARLIPTVPLRLNYILWIEDLLKVSGFCQEDYSSVYGIDIGTGASCIYPLLAAKKNKWHMIASEVDIESFHVAQENVQNNNLSHLVSLKLVEGNKLLTDLMDDKNRYAFSMCNPPFFSSELDLDYSSKSRSPSRPPPNNANTGDINELIAPGGEVAFVVKMIKESKEIGTKVGIYTSMVGHKSSLGVLKQELKNLQVASIVETRFCQGNTTRWGLAWTFDKSLALQKAYQTPSMKKTNIPMSYIVPHQIVDNEQMYTLETVSEMIMDILRGLKVKYIVKKKNKHLVILDVSAFKNSWSHQRWKKRQFKTPEGVTIGDPDKHLIQGNGANSSHQEERKSGSKRKCDEMLYDHFSSSDSNAKKVSNVNSEAVYSSDNEKSEQDKLDVDDERMKDQANDNPSSSVQERTVEQKKSVPLLEVTLFIRSLASEIHLELLWMGGTGGRDAMHQILQYIKNRLKEREN